MYETTGDLNEQHWLAQIDADMEMAEMRQMAIQRDADFRAGNCWHDGGFGYRETAFYPEQIGLSPGQMHCADCGQKVATELDCYFCGLPKHHCGGERGWADDHNAFTVPPMVLVCNQMEA